MMQTCMIVDVNCLCYRAFHKIDKLSFEDEPTSVLYGFFLSLQSLLGKFEPDVTAFCFDSRHSLRKELFPAYKEKRRTAEELEHKAVLYKQINRLPQLLKDMGFSNVYAQRGYEADDLIACVVQERKHSIIVSSDHDMYQLLKAGTWIHSPHKGQRYTMSMFQNQYNIDPDRWWRVLALAGCSTDNVPGVPGVGIDTAIRYLNGELDGKSKKCQAIEAHAQQIRLYRRLVRLPFTGAETPPLRPDDATDARWDAVVQRLGMKTLVRQYKSLRRNGTLVKGQRKKVSDPCRG